MLVVSWLVGMFMCFLTYAYLFCKFLDLKFRLDNKTLICAFIISFLYVLFSKNVSSNFIWLRPFIVNVFSFFLLKILFNRNIIETIISLLCIFIIMCISELLFSFIMVFFLKQFIPIGPEFISKWYGYFFSNFVIIIIMLCFSMIKYVNTFIKNIVKWHNANEKKVTMIYAALSMIIFVFFLYNNFINLLPNRLLLMTNLFSISVILFIIGYFNEKSNNNRIISEYDLLLGYVQKYEKVVEDKSKNQHEYKNQLVMLKSMINKSNKKAINYIESLYDDSKDDDNVELLKKLKYLPSGGLKGLVYYKIEEMKDNNINVFVNVSPELKNVKINKKIEKNLKDISKVIGVYMDNAIEASINSKEKFIILEVYLNDEELVFSLSNTYSNKIDLSMIDNEGYTTKGDGKGYGLSLVKDIIMHNNELRQEKELNGIYYTQRLYMKK